MPISSLRLKGFKSFGTQCDFTFSPRFTAIVGPNGSGKSNVLDALKWILGEASSSGLRITRQSDLLFQGSGSSPPAQSAEVTLRLTAGNDRATLRRIYTQEGGSSLFLDGGRILLQELGGVKQRFGLGGEGFALIGQGEIAQTIHQRPKERRRQLDSLFGIERYRDKRDESLRKLHDSQEEAGRIQTLIDELKSRRQEISDEVSKALEAQGILDELDALRHDYYFVRRYFCEKEQADLELQRHITETRLEGLEKWGRLWAFGLKSYEGKLQGYTVSVEDSSRLEALTSRKEAIHRRAFIISTQARDIKARRRILTDELDTLRLKREASSQERERAGNECENLRHELDRKQQEYSALEAEISRHNQEAQAVISRRNKLLDDMAGMKLTLSRREAELRVSSSQESLRQEISETEAELSSRQQTLSHLSERRNTLEEEFTRLTVSYQQKGSEIQALRRDLSHAESQYNHLSQSAAFTQGTYPEAVRIILTAAEKGLLCSRPKAAADVFTCRSQDVAEAVEAFLGGRQYWLLVRTMEEAQEGIDFLKSSKAGRVTYLALERCRERERDYRLSFGDGVIGWAMDLVDVAEEWRGAVSHMMGDLLIVRDYATGAEIVRHGARFPVATAEGDIFAANGTVSGGAFRQKAGAVTAQQKADELHRQLEGLTARITELTGQLEAASQSEREIRHHAEEAEAALDEVRAEISAEQRALKSAGKNLERLGNEQAKCESRSQELEHDIHDMAGKIEALEAELSGLPDVRTDDKGGSLLPLRGEISLLSERLNVSRTLFERACVDLSGADGEISRAEAEIESGLAAERADREELSRLGREISGVHSEELSLRREIARHQSEFAGAVKRLERLRKKSAISAEKISAMKGNIAGLDGKISRVEAELSQLVDLWEEKYPYDKNEARSTEGGRELTSSLRKLERELKSLGAYNLGYINEDNSLADRIDFLTDQLDDVNTSADELTALIADTDSQVERSFTASMSRIDSRFNELFVRLFGGGEARLTLQDGDSVWDRGVEIFARPPGKKLQNISQLSGGEQSLTSIALIFAALEAAGSPLAVLDEVDAALDEYNLVRFAELAREYSGSVQIIAMTHRRATMERADLIYGVTMIEAGLSAVVGINPENYA
ncbi:MAG: chromosome segregation protein SMC [Synergistaceae bacterium]|nr:chromosome segregation protein SMC [Synergistaceae bacterium]